ncbi:MAG TPA: thioesterase [Micrococcaceae bacterium]|nr:thioesterase [Micrococcaceae bacterium]
MPKESSSNPALEPWTIELGSLDQKMGVEILEESVQKVVARMPVQGNTQSFGLLHGGASLAVGEAVGSWAAVKYASTFGKVVVGVDVNATHHRSATEGYVFITATPIKLGRRMTSHDVVITDEQERRICTMRITNLVIDKPKH